MELPSRADASSRVTPAGNTALLSKTLNLLDRCKKNHVVLNPRMINYSCPSHHKPAYDAFERQNVMLASFSRQIRKHS